MKKSKLSLLIGALVFASATVANAAPITIDPDGGGASAPIVVGSLDWNVGNSIAVADAGQSLADPVAGQGLNLFAMSDLSAFNNAGGTPIGGTGLSTDFEWTFVAGLRETITAVVGPIFTTAVVNTATQFFEVWYDTGLDSSDLSGKGFNNGTKILEIAGLPGAVSGSGSFLQTSAPDANVTLDQFGGTNDYPGYTTVTGGGVTNIVGTVTFRNAAFFPTLAVGDILGLAFRTDQQLPYTFTDPSSCYWSGAAFSTAAGNGIAGGCGVAGDGGTIGLVNGVDGPNVIFETDARTTFNVPEPGSLALIGASLLGIFGIRRRKHVA